MSERYQSLHNWLSEIFKTSDYDLKPASEDASFRMYYRLILQGETYIVMDAPPQHENCERFVDITNRLQQCKVNAPVIHKENIVQGFLLLSDFGDELYLPNLTQKTADTLYKDAINTLVKIQVLGDVKNLNFYDEPLLRREMSLFNEWLLIKHLQVNVNDGLNMALEIITKQLVNNALNQPQVFVHRDYHSRNLMLTRDKNPGVIDYQDAVHGPLSYDLVSLLKDCYIKWSKDEINNWIDFYLKQLAESNPGYDINREQFQRWFDLMGVQRHLKASGIFARLSHRDSKHGFLKDIPRTLSYIVELKPDYPELNPLCDLIEESVLPTLEQKLCEQ